MEGEAMRPLTLTVTPWTLAIVRRETGEAIPPWLGELAFFAVARTPDELSLVLPEERVPAGWRAEGGWACLAVAGPLDFALTGVLASLVAPLAAAGVSVFALSTYDTDYLLVRCRELPAAVAALRRAGHRVEE
jgi:uncharacterized protein